MAVLMTSGRWEWCRLPTKGRLTLEFVTQKGRQKTLMLNDGKLAAFMPNLRLEHTSNMEKLLLVQLLLTSQLLTGAQVGCMCCSSNSSIQENLMPQQLPRLRHSGMRKTNCHHVLLICARVR